MKHIWTWGAVLGFLSVALGAFGAHALKSRLDADAMDIYRTGVQYHMAHSLAILAAALLADRLEGAASKLAYRAGWCFIFGTLVFSGSLYVLAVSGIKALGAITPIGGVLFLTGWVLLALAGRRKAT